MFFDVSYMLALWVVNSFKFYLSLLYTKKFFLLWEIFKDDANEDLGLNFFAEYTCVLRLYIGSSLSFSNWGVNT